jgi:carbamoyl-phosphate synthase large subunit
LAVSMMSARESLSSRSALIYHIPYYTTLAGALAVTEAIKALRAGSLTVAPLQSYVGKRA